MTKQVDTNEYLDMVSELVRQGESVSVPVAGESMRPFLRDKRDSVWLSPMPDSVERGDIVLYKRDSGQYVLHRVLRPDADGGFVMLGDGQLIPEPGIRRDQLAAKVTAVRRKGKMISEKSPVWRFYAKVWPRALPLRGKLLRIFR